MGFCAFEANENGWVCSLCERPYGDVVSAEYIARVRRMCPKNATARKVKEACQHRGDKVGTKECETCRGRVRIKLFACAVYGQCSIAKKLDGIACCENGLCAEYSAARRDADPDDGRCG